MIKNIVKNLLHEMIDEDQFIDEKKFIDLFKDVLKENEFKDSIIDSIFIKINNIIMPIMDDFKKRIDRVEKSIIEHSLGVQNVYTAFTQLKSEHDKLISSDLISEQVKFIKDKHLELKYLKNEINNFVEDNKENLNKLNRVFDIMEDR